ncbi:MAG: diaminopimelate epimerase [Faecousia sp.]
MTFYKYCGAGNDFVLLENFDRAISETDYPKLAKQLCRRKFSVGADGLMILEAAEQGGDCKMRFYNNDGSTAEMCGNGARCICRHCHDRGLSGEIQRIETPAGMVVGTRVSEIQYRIRLNSPSVVKLQEVIDGHVCDYLELGEPGIPHLVISADLSENRGKLREFARSLRHAAELPRGANVNLYELLGEDAVRLLTFERGVEDFTLACGTGTGATVAALTLRGLVSGEHVRVECEGGTLFVDVAVGSDETQIHLTGDAVRVFTGTLA